MSQDPAIFGSHERVEAQIGETLKAYRLNRNFTQTELAKKAGISRRTITTIENGGGSTLLTLIRIVRALEQDQLLGRLLEPPGISPRKLHQANMLMEPTRKYAFKKRKAKPAEERIWTWQDEGENQS